MKRLAVVLLAILPMLSLPMTAFAASDDAFYVNNAYFKGDGKYDIVVHDSNKETLQIYVNDKNPVKAKVNKNGWATFQKVKLTGQSKLSFAKKVKSKYVPVNYVKYIGVNGEQVKLSDTGPKHSYEDFYAWFTAHRYDGLAKDLGNTYQYITSTCAVIDRKFGPPWTACMQKGYKDYLKADTFVGDNWMGDYSTMVGDMNDAITEKSLYGAYAQTDTYKKAMQEAQRLYERLAVTN